MPIGRMFQLEKIFGIVPKINRRRGSFIKDQLKRQQTMISKPVVITPDIKIGKKEFNKYKFDDLDLDEDEKEMFQNEDSYSDEDEDED